MFFDRRNCRRIRDLVEICGFLEVAIEQLEKLERETLLEIEQEKAQKALVNAVDIKVESQSKENKNVSNTSAGILPHLNNTPTSSCSPKPDPALVLSSGIALAQNLTSTNCSTITTPINNVDQRMKNEDNLPASQFNHTENLSNSTENSLKEVFHSQAVYEVLDSLKNSNNEIPTVKVELKKEPVIVNNLLDHYSNTGNNLSHNMGCNPQLPDFGSSTTQGNNVENFASYNILNDNSQFASINGQNTASLENFNTRSSDNQEIFKVFIKFKANFSPNEIKHILNKNGINNIQDIFLSKTKTVITFSEKSEVRKLMRMRSKKGLNKLLAHYIGNEKKTNTT